MRFNMVKIGTEVMDKVTGNQYRVFEINGEGTMALAGLIDSETNECREAENLTITEDNCLSFRAIHIPEDTTIPAGYSVKNGVLLKDGKTVTEQGDIVVRKILACRPGYLVLSAERRNVDPDEPEYTKNWVSVMTYAPDTDRFFVITDSTPEPVLIRDNDKYAAFVWSASHEVVTDVDGEEKKETVFDGSYILKIYGTSRHQCNTVRVFDRPIDTELVDILAAGNNPEYLIFKSAYSVDDENVITPCNKITYIGCNLNDENLDLEIIGEFAKEDAIQSVSLVKIDKGGFFIKGKKLVVYKGLGLYDSIRMESSDIEKVEGKYLVDINRTGNDIVFAVADDFRDINFIKSHRTKDRGFIVTVE